MNIYPAIDILDGQCVRLLQGDYDQSTEYGDPLHMAMVWQDQGAAWLHVVDLNGARDGSSKHSELVREIVRQTELKVQLGGGIRTLQDIERWLKVGVERVILGTVAAEDPGLVAEAVTRFGAEHIVVALDARGDEVATRGWFKRSGQSVKQLCAELHARGVNQFIYTDIERDGSLHEPNFGNIKQLLKVKDIRLIASGGISSIKALRELKVLGVHGAIVGKSLYEGLLSLEDCLAVSGEVD